METILNMKSRRKKIICAYIALILFANTDCAIVLPGIKPFQSNTCWHYSRLHCTTVELFCENGGCILNEVK